MIGLGGLLGAIGRYTLSEFVQRFHSTSFPAGTLVVNVLGCFFLGVVMHLIQSQGLFSTHTRMFITVGLLGAATTFSTFGHETVTLLDSGKVGLAFLNVVGNVVLGFSAVWLGTTLVRASGH
ncbi:MAG: fluoride efflux transporter CrcB [bacterium]|nr:fluoride efflux transporter CrcB [bacterium]